MKKVILVVLCSLMFLGVYGQDKKASIGFGIGGAAASAKDIDGDKDSGFGINFYINGMYNINENLSAGIEYNGNAVVIAGIDQTGFDFKATSLNGILAKGRYAFGTGGTRFYGGIMLGVYRITPGEVSFDLLGTPVELVFDPKTTFGFAPEIGVMLGSFQLATSYHFPGKYKIDLPDGNGGTTTVETTYTMWQFNIGWNIGLIKN